MSISAIAIQYGLPLGITAVILAAILGLLWLLGRREAGLVVWDGIADHPIYTALVCVVALAAVGFAAFMVGQQANVDLRSQATSANRTATNIMPERLQVFDSLTATLKPVSPFFVDPATNGRVVPFGPGDGKTFLQPQNLLRSPMITVQPGATYRYSMLNLVVPPSTEGKAQVRFIWFDRALNVISWDDVAAWSVPRYAGATQSFDTAGPDTFHTGTDKAPDGAVRLEFEVRNVGSEPVFLTQLTLWQEGVRVEQYPNGAQGALAFSFDWESAMGGAIHSKGMEAHDLAGAAQHGLAMRQGADWLNNLFATYQISTTFYATGYNLLDGNTQRLTFSGNPTYKWASPKNGWASNYWLINPWYSDDPFGTAQSDPAWYFGDQTRALLAAGDEIGSLTFGHLYVRGTTLSELATDMSEWLKYAKAAGVAPPTTFAFPWRSSNSLTADFYDLLYKDGIRAVTRLYDLDLKDRYTLSAPAPYPNMVVMPDFLLGVSALSAGEEAGTGTITEEQGIEVIDQALARRGTTSFWQHPEQLSDDPSFFGVRTTWQTVVKQAASERDNGRLWIDTVANITAYESAVNSVTASLDQGFLGFGGWQVRVTNNSGKEIEGLTLTLPGDVASASSNDAQVLTVYQPDNNTTRVSRPDQPVYPARQLVVSTLKPGTTTINIEWAPSR